MNKKAKKYNSDILNDIFSEITPQEQKRTDNRMLLAAKIKDGMDAKGWKNKQLAEALNQQPSVITKWLSGTHNFTSDTLSDIENVLGIKLLAVEEKKEQQIVTYRTLISATVVNEPEKGILNPKSAQYQYFSPNMIVPTQS